MAVINSKNLVFLISQPRSGSSLLQQLLINSGRVMSVPEPWLMLPLVHVYKGVEQEDGYNPRYANINFLNYLSRYEGAMDDLVAAIKNLALSLYNLNKLEGMQSMFLDKTPRYYHIVKELGAIFPDARYIFLTRNPAAVFSSILDYNFHGDVEGLFRPDRQDDLLKAPRVITGLMKEGANEQYHFIRYEDMVTDEALSLSHLFSFLGIDTAVPGKFGYSLDEAFQSSNARDTKSLSRHDRIVGDYLGSWKKTINDRRKKRLLIEYLEILGRDVFDVLGYDHAGTLDQVKSHRVRFCPAKGWDWHLTNRTSAGQA